MYLAPVLECQLLLHPNGSFVHLVTKALCSEPRGGHDMSGRFAMFSVAKAGAVAHLQSLVALRREWWRHAPRVHSKR